MIITIQRASMMNNQTREIVPVFGINTDKAQALIAPENEGAYSFIAARLLEIEKYLENHSPAETVDEAEVTTTENGELKNVE